MFNLHFDGFENDSELFFHWEVPSYLQLPGPDPSADLASGPFSRKRLVFASEEVFKRATLQLQISELVDLALVAMYDPTADPPTTAGYWLERIALEELTVIAFHPRLVEHSISESCGWPDNRPSLLEKPGTIHIIEVDQSKRERLWQSCSDN